MGEDDAPRRRDEPPPIEWIRPGDAQAPPRGEPPPAAWIPRPEEFQAPPRAIPSARPTFGRAAIAGVCLILAGALGIASLGAFLAFPPSEAEIENATAGLSPEFVVFLQVCGFVSIYAQAMAVLGGILAIRRSNWRLVVVCALFSILTVGFYFEASMIGLFGLILTLISRGEFRS